MMLRKKKKTLHRLDTEKHLASNNHKCSYFWVWRKFVCHKLCLFNDRSISCLYSRCSERIGTVSAQASLYSNFEVVCLNPWVSRRFWEKWFGPTSLPRPLKPWLDPPRSPLLLGICTVKFWSYTLPLRQWVKAFCTAPSTTSSLGVFLDLFCYAMSGVSCGKEIAASFFFFICLQAVSLHCQVVLELYENKFLSYCSGLKGSPGFTHNPS